MAAPTRRRSDPSFLNLDSLVDIVSNIVGILVILAAFMALFGLINPAPLLESQRARVAVQPPKKLLVPWSHATNKNSVLFVAQGNRLLRFDLRAVEAQLTQNTQAIDQLAKRLDIDEAYADFYAGAYWSGDYRTTPHGRPGWEEGDGPHRVRAPRAAFPTYNFSVTSGSGSMRSDTSRTRTRCTIVASASCASSNHRTNTVTAVPGDAWNVAGMDP